jgi:hypothetical protein
MTPSSTADASMARSTATTVSTVEEASSAALVATKALMSDFCSEPIRRSPSRG